MELSNQIRINKEIILACENFEKGLQVFNDASKLYKLIKNTSNSNYSNNLHNSVKISLENYKDIVEDRKTNVALESHKPNRQIALEGLGSVLNSIWKAICNFFKKIWNWITGKGKETTNFEEEVKKVIEAETKEKTKEKTEEYKNALLERYKKLDDSFYKDKFFNGQETTAANLIKNFSYTLSILDDLSDSLEQISFLFTQSKNFIKNPKSVIDAENFYEDGDVIENVFLVFAEFSGFLFRTLDKNTKNHSKDGPTKIGPLVGGYSIETQRIDSAAFNYEKKDNKESKAKSLEKLSKDFSKIYLKMIPVTEEENKFKTVDDFNNYSTVLNKDFKSTLDLLKQRYNKIQLQNKKVANIIKDLNNLDPNVFPDEWKDNAEVDEIIKIYFKARTSYLITLAKSWAQADNLFISSSTKTLKNVKEVAKLIWLPTN